MHGEDTRQPFIKNFCPFCALALNLQGNQELTGEASISMDRTESVPINNTLSMNKLLAD